MDYVDTSLTICPPLVPKPASCDNLRLDAPQPDGISWSWTEIPTTYSMRDMSSLFVVGNLLHDALLWGMFLVPVWQLRPKWWLEPNGWTAALLSDGIGRAHQRWRRRGEIQAWKSSWDAPHSEVATIWGRSCPAHRPQFWCSIPSVWSVKYCSPRLDSGIIFMWGEKM